MELSVRHHDSSGQALDTDLRCKVQQDLGLVRFVIEQTGFINNNPSEKEWGADKPDYTLHKTKPFEFG